LSILSTKYTRFNKKAKKIPLVRGYQGEIERSRMKDLTPNYYVTYYLNHARP